jgi:PEP-CTERM motif
VVDQWYLSDIRSSEKGRLFMPRLACVAALACCLSAPLQARADTITISGGTLTAEGGLSGPISFSLTGDGFAVMGGGQPGFVGPSFCFPCVAGDQVNFDSYFAGESTLGSGPATVNGVSYDKVWYAGVLAFDGEAMAFPEASTSLDLTSPFNLVSDATERSFLEGYLTSDLQGPALFRVDVVGRGVARATFLEGPEAGQFFFENVDYSFLASEPIPEPTSLLLLATGLVAAGVRQWRSRTRS